MYHRLITTKINKIFLYFMEDITASATAKKVRSFVVLAASNFGRKS